MGHFHQGVEASGGWKDDRDVQVQVHRTPSDALRLWLGFGMLKAGDHAAWTVEAGVKDGR